MTPSPAISPPPMSPSTPRPAVPRRPRPRPVWRAGALATIVCAASALLPAGVPGEARAQEDTDTALAYCTNLADAAAEARHARQAARLEAMQAEIEERLVALESKRAEYEDWLERRERFLTLAQDSLVTIYAGMRPDAASEQLAAMDELTAAAIVAKLAPRAASAVLNEMEAEKAARIATIMAGLARARDGRDA